MLSYWVNHGGQYISVSAFDFCTEMVSVIFPKESKVSEVKATGRRAKQPDPPISYHQDRVTGINPDS